MVKPKGITMANPNRTFAAARARKTTTARERTFRTEGAANAARDEWKAEGYTTVRVTSFKVGPRGPKGWREWVVRAYV